MERVQDRLELLTEELIDLEKQLTAEQEKLTEDNNKSKKIINCGFELENSREILARATTKKGKLEKKFNIYSKIDNISTRFFWVVLGPGSLISFLLIFISGLSAMLIGYSVTIFLTLLISAISLGSEKKCNELLNKIDIHNQVINFEKEKSQEYEIQIRKLSADSMTKMQRNLSNMAIGNIKDNIVYVEEIIWTILNGIDPKNDNEYIAELRDSFYPKLFVPEIQKQKLIKNK